MLGQLRLLSGHRMDEVEYGRDFDVRLHLLRGHPVYKMERLQTFHQPESESWMAYRSGDLQRSMELLESARVGLETAFAELSARGVQIRRVRVVEWPLTPYLRWELNSLYVRAQCGENTRVVGPDAVAGWELRDVVPEVVTLGREAAYEILYGADGVIQGGVLHTDRILVDSCRDQIAAVYAQGEDLTPFFERTVALLP